VALIFRPVVSQQQDAACGQAIDEGIKDDLASGLKPVQILDDEEQGLTLALQKEEPLQRIQDEALAVGRIEQPQRIVPGEGVEKPEEGSDGVSEPLIEVENLAGDLLADSLRSLALSELKIFPQDGNDRRIRGGLAVRHRAAGEDEPALGAVRVEALEEQSGLADAGLSDHAHSLAVALQGLLKSPV
jgi:hypothetical protein